ncbi:MAG: hypothetical protein ABI432_07730 [Flavobacteriales bacterium]
MTARRYPPLFAMLMGCSVFSQTETPASTRTDQEVQLRAAEVKDPVQGGWSNLEEKKDLFFAPQVDMDLENNCLEQLNQFRWERNVALTQNQGVIPPADQARLQEIAGSLSSVAPQSFEAHLANFYVAFPQPAAFMELDLATAKGRERDELIAPQLVNSARKDNPVEQTKWAGAMRDRGNVAPGLYLMAEDILSSVDQNGVLIAAGEMDAYPLWTEQFASGKRKDVLVVDERLLIDPAYRARIWDRTKARGPIPTTAEGFAEHLELSTDRPVFLSLALGQDAAGGALRDKLYVTGLAMRLSSEPVDNIPQLALRWKRMNKAMDTGPLAQNYLLPGAVLLIHYRAVGQESEAARLEHELRDLAERAGATQRMIKSGVFQH